MPGKSPEEFRTRVKIIAEGLGKASNAVGAQACYLAGEYLAKYTPIDTGQAKSNWQASRVSPRTVRRGAYASGIWGSTEGANEAATIAQIRKECVARKKNQQMFLTNNLPYISKLDAAYDTIKRKFPTPPAKYRRGFFQVAVQRAAEAIRNSRAFKQALAGKGASIRMEDI